MPLFDTYVQGGTEHRMLHNYPGPRHVIRDPNKPHGGTQQYGYFYFLVIAAESKKSLWGVDRISDINLVELSFCVHVFSPPKVRCGYTSA